MFISEVSRTWNMEMGAVSKRLEVTELSSAAESNTAMDAYVRGEGKVRVERYRSLARANGVWKPEWSALDPGRTAMVTRIRLRSLLKQGKDVRFPQ